MTNRHKKVMGDSILEMAQALDRYCAAYKEEIGDILRGLDTLLNGELGPHDGGKLSRLLHRIAEQHGLADKNGEF